MSVGAKVRKAPWVMRYRVGSRAASRMRQLAIQMTHLHCRVEFQGPVNIGPGFSLFIPDGGSFVVGHGVEFRRSFVCEIRGNGRVEIGDGTIFTANTLIQCSTSIDIGKGCVFGQSTLIVDGYHRYRGTEEHWVNQGYDFRPLRIGDGAGVSDKCTVQADIGERAAVASGSVVNRPVPPYCLAVGSPARVIRYFGPPERRDELVPGRRRRINADRFSPTAAEQT